MAPHLSQPPGRQVQVHSSGVISGLLLWDRCLCVRVRASENTAGLANRVKVTPVTLYMAARESGGSRSYVPDELAPDLERAIRNGRHLQEVMMEAGRRYALALKNERRSRRGG